MQDQAAPTRPDRPTADRDEAELAILGAGPIGLEAALAADQAGIPYVLIEQGPTVASNVRSWGHVRLFSSWDLDVSPRQRAALAAAGIESPAGEACPTGTELVERVLEPLARLPAIAPHLRLRTRVVAVGREGLVKAVEIGSPARAGARFRLLVTGPAGESVLFASSVLDCTGSYELPGCLGDGGIPAPGERGAGERIVRRLPDLGAEGAEWGGRRILLAGAGHSAQTAALALDALARERPATRVHWLLRREQPAIAPDPEDALVERRRLHEDARALIAGANPCFEIHLGATVDRLDQELDGALRVTLGHPVRGRTFEPAAARELLVDRVLALVGSHGDRSLYGELQVHECYASGGPMKLAAALLASASSDCLAQQSPGPALLETTEPGFFILGSKSYGRNSAFLLRIGWQQVEDALGLIAAARAGAPEVAYESGV